MLRTQCFVVECAPQSRQLVKVCLQRDLQLKTLFESFFQFLNTANASTQRSMPSLVYVPMKPFQNCRILFSISPKSRSIALLGPNDITVCRSKPTLSRAHGYHDPPSMNIRGSFPLQACFTFLRKAIASKPLLPKETQTPMTFSSSRSTAPQMNTVVPLSLISFSSTAIHFRLFFSADPSNKSLPF